MPSSSERLGVLYILEIQGSIKIGFSSNLKLMKQNIRKLNIQFSDDSLEKLVNMYGFVKTVSINKEFIRKKLNNHGLRDSVLNENSIPYLDFYINSSTTRNVLASLIGKSRIRDYNKEAAKKLIANLHTNRPYTI